MAYSREELLQHHAVARLYQERYETGAFQPWGQRAPAPVAGELATDYRRKLAVAAKRLLPDGHELKRVQFRSLQDDVLDRFEPQLIRDCGAAAYCADSVAPGEMRRVERVDNNGHRWIEWVGRECFTKEMMRPGRRVASFRAGDHYVDASGRALR